MKVHRGTDNIMIWLGCETARSHGAVSGQPTLCFRSQHGSSAGEDDEDEGAFGDLDARRSIKRDSEKLVHLKTQKRPVKPKRARL